MGRDGCEAPNRSDQTALEPHRGSIRGLGPALAPSLRWRRALSACSPSRESIQDRLDDRPLAVDGRGLRPLGEPGLSVLLDVDRLQGVLHPVAKGTGGRCGASRIRRACQVVNGTGVGRQMPSTSATGTVATPRRRRRRSAWRRHTSRVPSRRVAPTVMASSAFPGSAKATTSSRSSTTGPALRLGNARRVVYREGDLVALRREGHLGRRRSRAGSRPDPPGEDAPREVSPDLRRAQKPVSLAAAGRGGRSGLHPT